MAQTPGAPAPPVQLPPVQRSNSTVIWVVVIVCLGAFCVVALLVGAAVLFPVFSQAKEAAKKTACLSNVKQIGLGHLLYCADNNERFVAAEGWESRIQKHAPTLEALKCPALAGRDGTGSGYAYNSGIAGKDSSKIAAPQETILVFEIDSATGRSAGGEESLVNPGRHSGSGAKGSSYGFANGAARFILDSSPHGNWKP